MPLKCTHKGLGSRNEMHFLRDTLHPDIVKDAGNRWRVQLVVCRGSCTPSKELGHYHSPVSHETGWRQSQKCFEGSCYSWEIMGVETEARDLLGILGNEASSPCLPRALAGIRKNDTADHFYGIQMSNHYGVHLKRIIILYYQL